MSIVSTNPTFPQGKLKVLHDAVMHRNTQGILQCIDEDTSVLNAPLEVCTYMYAMNVYQPQYICGMPNI